MRILKRKSQNSPTAIEKFDFDRPFMSLREAINRLFDESILDPFEFSSFPMEMVTGSKLFPKVDIAETEKEIKITANVPGVDPDKIEIEIGEDSIVLSGKIEKETEEKDKKFYRFEREFGEFRREFPLPAKINTDQSEAVIKNGVLTITLPKTEIETKKKLKVKSE